MNFYFGCNTKLAKKNVKLNPDEIQELNNKEIRFFYLENYRNFKMF